MLLWFRTLPLHNGPSKTAGVGFFSNYNQMILRALFFITLVLQPPSAFSQSKDDFATKMYRQLASEEGNLFFSPHSLSSAIGMAYSGARGQTAKEMKYAMSFAGSPLELTESFQQHNAESTASNEGVTVSIANGLYIYPAYNMISENYKKFINKYYLAEIFSGGVSEINEWVKSKTHGRIERILERISANTVGVLLNAIYFKGAWDVGFSHAQTQKSDFYLDAENKILVEMMHQNSKMKLYRALCCLV